MKLIKKLIMLTLIVSCARQAEKVEKVNSEFEISFLFEYEGCKVYRFYDVGRYIHFTNCNETITNISCGKNCTQIHSVRNKGN